MKKLFRRNWVIPVAVILMSSFMVACEDDDDDDDNNSGKTDPNTVATSNLVAYFPFDAEPAPGSAVANSNNSITYVRKVGNVTFSDGRRGNGLMGNANNSYLEYDVAAGSALRTMDEFTLSGWIKSPVTTSGAAMIFSINGGDPTMGSLALIQESQPTGDSIDLKLYLYDAASAEWKGQDIRADRAQFLNDKWFHLTAVYRKSSSTMEFWANGVRVFQSIKYAGPVPQTGPQPLLEGISLANDITKIYFGAWPRQIAGNPESWMTNYKGMVDEFRIYSKALTDAEILDLYEAEVSQINE